MVEPSARYDEVRIPLGESVHGLDRVSGVLGVPRWWPTGARVGVVLAHGSAGGFEDPLIADLHRDLTESRFLCMRFNFPFAEAGKRRPDPMPVLRRCFKAAVDALTQDPTAAPAHLFLIGTGLGAQVAAEASIARLRADGLIFLGYPLHDADRPAEATPDPLFRVVAPMAFLQGTRDRYCEVDALRRALKRVGAPTSLFVVEEADHRLRVPKKSGREQNDVRREVLAVTETWIERALGG